jgi:putative intracellular protease/amidase
MKKNIYIYLVRGFADWELGFITPELSSGRYFKAGIEPFTVKTFALTDATVVSMGGLRVIPDCTIDEVSSAEAALLLLPGSNSWLEAENAPALKLAKRFLSSGVLVAAICGATIALGKAGVLDDYAHTSNDLDLLKSVCPGYKGEMHYQNQPAVCSGNLITANGTAPLEFAYRIIKELDVFNTDTLEAWYALYLKHEAQYYYKLVGSLSGK